MSQLFVTVTVKGVVLSVVEIQQFKDDFELFVDGLDVFLFHGDFEQKQSEIVLVDVLFLDLGQVVTALTVDILVSSYLVVQVYQFAFVHQSVECIVLRLAYLNFK